MHHPAGDTQGILYTISIIEIIFSAIIQVFLDNPTLPVTVLSSFSRKLGTENADKAKRVFIIP